MMKLKALTGKVNRRKALPIQMSDAKSDRFLDYEGKPIDSQHLLISMLLPPAVKEFFRQLEDEVECLCGKRYEHGTANQRWGSQTGTITLGNQKVRIDKPRVRNQLSRQEVQIPIYDRFKDEAIFDDQIFAEGLKKVSQRDFQKGIPKIAASFGFTKCSVSRRWIKATEARLKELNDRNIANMNIVAVFIDGKRFRDHGVVVALGVSSEGKKHVLGIFECSTENSSACNELLSSLEERGLPKRELVFIVDGGSGLNKSLEDRYDVHLLEKRRAVRVRCYIHKWRNIEPNLPRGKTT